MNAFHSCIAYRLLDLNLNYCRFARRLTVGLVDNISTSGWCETWLVAGIQEYRVYF